MSQTESKIRYRAVIFDRDGVLTDFDLAGAAAFFKPLVPLSLIELGNAWNAWGTKHGFPSSLAAEKQFWADFWQHLVAELGLSTAVHEQLQQVDYTTFLTPCPEALAALQTVRAAGLRIGVLSNFSLASLEPSLEAVGLADWIDEACAATVIGVAKPEPEAYLIAAERLGVPPEACLFFDDEPPCVAGAKAVGMSAYLVDRRQKSHQLAQNVVCDLTAVGLLLDNNQD